MFLEAKLHMLFTSVDITILMCNKLCSNDSLDHLEHRVESESKTDAKLSAKRRNIKEFLY